MIHPMEIIHAYRRNIRQRPSDRSLSTGWDILYDIENIATGAGNDTITGSEFRNRIDAGSGNDDILSYGGNDTVYGRSGIDDVGGEGNDFVDGGADDDWVLGVQGNDRLIGGDGDDLLNGDGWSAKQALASTS